MKSHQERGNVGLHLISFLLPDFSSAHFSKMQVSVYNPSEDRVYL